ncbi:predicted protein [Pediculus humanus corporis]|uniref:Predicted protein n=1 Tax=Pediculus humanus subsp. corporis TaxID=121224 RepID=E0VU05_PEDHC|nr:uncharacterized protein Phum_PHUM441240 [Pediculus humanus corporis]EEB16861.1 predicted protein [Pediculus humanus corporis]
MESSILFGGLILVTLILGLGNVAECKKSTQTTLGTVGQPPGGGSSGSIKEEPVIEEVSAKQLEKILNEKDYVAVFWYTRSCHTCDKVLEELEKIDDDTDHFGVDFVKINDKRLAKQFGIKNFPALTYFREKEPIIYEGDLMDEENVLDFLTSLEAMDLPDRIEEVNAKILEKIIEDSDYVAVLFCPSSETCPATGTVKPECKRCTKALQELENIDDEADELGIGFVKIMDAQLAEEYNLGELPKLVYYRNQIPIIYENELTREEDVLEWLVQNKSTGDEEDVIEDVTVKTLNTLIDNIDNLVVLFYDEDDEESMTIITELEKIDDDCDKHGIQFVKINDPKAAEEFGIDKTPALVYFEKEIPNLYDGDLENEDEILEWLVSQLESDEIEDVTDEMLDKLIKDGKTVAVLFYDNNDRKSQRVLGELENIDDECDKLGIAFVKIDNDEEAREYGLDKIPALLYFENGVPLLFEGNLEEEEKVLEWLEHQRATDEIEDVTDEMLDILIEKKTHVAVLFYDKDQRESKKVLEELENIDDDCDRNNIAFVKIDNDDEAKEYGIDELPTLVFFEKRIPHIYDGDLTKEDDLLKWLIFQKKHSEIPDVTNEMMDKLLENTPYLVVLFYDKDDNQDKKILNELENIDDDLEKEGIVIVKMDDDKETKEFGIDDLPALVYFENKLPAIYEGDLFNEDEVLKWLVEQKNTATIEEVTDEILENLISEYEYVVVYFSGPCEEDEDCDKTLDELENIDDELDENGIVFVTTEDTGLAKKHGVKSYPALAFFRNKIPLFFKGDLRDEDEVLAWLTDEDTLEIPGKIEEVNTKMLDKIIAERPLVVVFFYSENDKKSQKIINELENIDDECEEKDVTFVKISDKNIKQEYDLPKLPCLGFYRKKFRTLFDGDLMNEESILEWVLDLHDKSPDVIENVDRKTLQMLIDDVEHLAVFFYDDSKKSSAVLEELETIDDDAEKHGIQFVKSNDGKLASEIGIFSFPALVYYETGVPIMYDGNLKNEEKVLEWLIEQKIKPLKTKKNVEDDKVSAEKIIKAYKMLKFLREKKMTANDDVNDDDDVKRQNDKIKFISKSFNDLNNDNDNKGLTSKSGDTCFIIGLGDKTAVPKNSYEPYKCCPTSVKTDTRVAKATKDHHHHHHTTSVAKKDSSSTNHQDKNYLRKTGNTNNNNNNNLMKGKKGSAGGGDILNEDEVLNWMIKQKEDESIEEVTRSKLFEYIERKEFLAVVFYKENDEESLKILRHIELIDDEAAEYGIRVVKCHDLLMAKKYGYRNPPGITYFRKGKAINYDGDIDDEEEVLDWLSHPENMELTDHIEKVNKKMFDKIRLTSDYTAVFFYSNECKQCDRVLMELEHIDDDAANAGIKFVKINDKKMAKEMGIFALPAVAFYKMGSKEPVIYAGDLYDEEQILQWLLTQKDPSGDAIEELDGENLKKIIRDSDYLAVYFCSENCGQCQIIVEELENIDDDCDRHGIQFVKTQDLEVAKEFGVIEFPSLVYFEKGVPNVFEGDLMEEEEVLQWLITQKTEDRIELITRVMLEDMVQETQYLAVYFYKLNCHICDELLEGLENIDDECDVFGIHLVKIQDPPLAKRYGIKTFPALVYFRNGNPLLYEGDLQNEEAVLEWLIDDDNRELADEIEQVNSRMLERLLDESAFLAVFMYDEDDCPDCEEILNALEKIDGEADQYGIDMVKISDEEVASKYNVANTPALVYFRKRAPLIYDGDLLDYGKILTWLTSLDVFDNKNEIEEVNKKMLDKLLDENEFLAVYFYELDSLESVKVTEILEEIDGEINNIDITFVKMADPRYARKWGVTKLPSIVFFRKRFPSIYRGGEFQKGKDVLEWLRKNRYRAPELSLFMYILIAIVIAFVLYTAFLLNFFRPVKQA